MEKESKRKDYEQKEHHRKKDKALRHKKKLTSS